MLLMMEVLVSAGNATCRLVGVWFWIEVTGIGEMR